MELRGPVLCATDLSDASDAALRQGLDIASEIGAVASVCHVLPEIVKVRLLFPQNAGVDTSFRTELMPTATAAVHARMAGIIGADAAKLVSVEIDSGTPHAGILSVAERLGAGLIVVGAGGTAVRVARSAAVPVLVARPSPTGGGVLGATDFSDPSLPAVHMGAAEARRRNVRFRLVHCLDLDESAYVGAAGHAGAIPVWPLPPSVTTQLETWARDRLEAALATVGIDAEPLLIHSSPAAGILDAAQSRVTSLIVVGTRGRTGLARLALGSVAEAVMNRAPCSVLVVPLHPA